jgi:hypothetical protein
MSRIYYIFLSNNNTLLRIFTTDNVFQCIITYLYTIFKFFKKQTVSERKEKRTPYPPPPSKVTNKAAALTIKIFSAMVRSWNLVGTYLVEFFPPQNVYYYGLWYPISVGAIAGAGTDVATEAAAVAVGGETSTAVVVKTAIVAGGKKTIAVADAVEAAAAVVLTPVVPPGGVVFYRPKLLASSCCARASLP